jgi:hypothetical protein
MKLDYKLNLDLYEKCATLVNKFRWGGMIGLHEKVDEYASDLSIHEYRLLKYAISLIIDGRDPDNVFFFLEEVYEEIKENTPKEYDLHRNLRLIVKFASWIQCADVDSHTILLNALDDLRLASAYKNWRSMNEYDTSITFEQSQKISTEEWLRIRESNKTVKNYYDELFKR